MQARCSGYSLCHVGIAIHQRYTRKAFYSDGKVAYNPGELAGLAFLISQGLLVEVVDRVPLVFE